MTDYDIKSTKREHVAGHLNAKDNFPKSIIPSILCQIGIALKVRAFPSVFNMISIVKQLLWKPLQNDKYKNQPEHPRHPQRTHSITRSESTLDLGTLHTQLVPKLVSLVWMQRRQQRFSYPCFFHLAISWASTNLASTQKSYSSLLISSFL